jgi:hypothetical protein
MKINDGDKHYFMDLLWRSHHSGKDGEIHAVPEGITTAKEMVNRVILEVP